MKPFFVAIAGPSGSGKSRLAHALLEFLGTDSCGLISLDVYYKDLSHLPFAERQLVNFDHPSAMDDVRWAADLDLLRHGIPARIPVYDFATHTRSSVEREQQPKPIVIIEGLFALSMEPDATPFDLKIYLDADTETCLARRLARDVVERGREEADIRSAFDQFVRPSLGTVIGPQKPLADLVLDGTLTEQALVKACVEHLPDETKNKMSLPPVFAELARRLGKEKLGERMSLQASHWAGMHHQGEGLLVIERVVPLDTLVNWILRVTGLSAAGHRGAIDLRIEQNVVCSAAVPNGLDGFRILQLSDLHLDLQTGVMPRLLEAIASVEYDLAVITGDFRNSTAGDFEDALRETSSVLQALKLPVYGILGNHDFVETVPRLEEMGLSMLLNETVTIKHNGACLLLAGIDDPHFYKTHDISKVGGTPPAPILFRVLLSHSPETFQEAARHFDFMLSGHTHGGQICLPGGFPVIRNGRCPRRMLSGAWRHDSLLGYTSRGTGCCGVAARFFCPPEITLHTLRAG